MKVLGRVVVRLLHALYRQRVAVVLVLLLAAGASVYFFWLASSNIVTHAQAAGVQPIEVVVEDVQQRQSNFLLILKEKNGNRRISMAMGQVEALTIAATRRQVGRGDAPQVYDLLRDTIQQLGARVDRVVVNDANQTQYFAQVILSAGDDTRVIKTEPAEAVALALKAGAPVFVEQKVLDQYGTRGSS